MAKTTVKKTNPKKSALKLEVFDISNGTKSSVKLPEFLQIKINQQLLAKLVRIWQLRRTPTTAHTKDRSERRGGGAKPWRQKGTGNARVGSRRSPIWRKGGITFGPRKEKTYNQKINKKEKKLALKMAIAYKYQSNKLFVIKPILVAKPKTKLAAEKISIIEAKIKEYNSKKTTLIVFDKVDENIRRSFKNLENIKIKNQKSVSFMDYLSNNQIILNVQALKEIENEYK
jgi:large subunit ribosomal protein L4